MVRRLFDVRGATYCDNNRNSHCEDEEDGSEESLRWHVEQVDCSAVISISREHDQVRGNGTKHIDLAAKGCQEGRA